MTTQVERTMEGYRLSEAALDSLMLVDLPETQRQSFHPREWPKDMFLKKTRHFGWFEGRRVEFVLDETTNPATIEMK